MAPKFVHCPCCITAAGKLRITEQCVTNGTRLAKPLLLLMLMLMLTCAILEQWLERRQKRKEKIRSRYSAIRYRR